MQSTIINNTILKSASVSATCKVAASGQLFQVRNHVKMYPWRFNRTRAESHLDNTRTPYTDKNNINEFKSSMKRKKPWQVVIPKDRDNRFNAYQNNDNYTSNPKVAKSTALRKFDSLALSLQHRGHARQRRSYTPPQDVADKVLEVCEAIELQSDDTLDDREIKFKLITTCIEVFKHDMPGSYLNDINTVQDVIDYFSTEVLGVNPYENLVAKTNELPPNLAIISQAHRYNKETDEYFKGHNALPGIISQVPGLRGGRKYEILNQDEFQWPDI